MKVCFIDMDGVYNTHLTPVRQTAGFDSLMLCADPEKVFLFNKFIDQYPDIKVVLSSSWRLDPKWRETMKANGFIFEFFGETPDFKGKTSRGTEIAEWLRQQNELCHPKVERYAIIDDNADMLDEQKPNFFKTEWGIGLTEEIMERVRAHLCD